MTPMTAPASWHPALVTASALTVVVAVGADLLAGSHPAHAISVGVASAALGALRIRMAGSLRALFGLASAAIVAQPVLHAADELNDVMAWSGHIVAVDVTESLLPLLLTAATVVALGVAEPAIELTVTGVRTWWGVLRRLFGAPVPPPTAPLLGMLPQVPALRPLGWRRFAARRGPPLAVMTAQ